MKDTIVFCALELLGGVLGILAFHLFQNWREKRRKLRESEKAVEAEIVELEPKKPVKPKTEPPVITVEPEEKVPAIPEPRREGSGRFSQDDQFAAAALRASRPDLTREQVVCFKCKKPVAKLSSTGMHKGRAPGGFEDEFDTPSDGWVMAMAQCHGNYCDIVVPFAELRKNPTLVVTVFEDPHVRLVAPFGNCGIGGAKKTLPGQQRKLAYL